MTIWHIVVIASAALSIAFAVLADRAAKDSITACERSVEMWGKVIDALHDRGEWDRKSLACWLEINAATKENRPVAEWAWAWAHGIDEDA